MQLKLTLENLHKLGIIDDDTKLEEHSTIIMDPAYVHINTETEKMVQQFKAEEEKNGIIARAFFPVVLSYWEAG